MPVFAMPLRWLAADTLLLLQHTPTYPPRCWRAIDMLLIIDDFFIFFAASSRQPARVCASATIPRFVDETMLFVLRYERVISYNEYTTHQ